MISQYPIRNPFEYQTSIEDIQKKYREMKEAMICIAPRKDFGITVVEPVKTKLQTLTEKCERLCKELADASEELRLHKEHLLKCECCRKGEMKR